MNKVTIFDTTLRDGSQAEGMAFSVNDKLHILKILDDLGVSFIEAGNPFFNPKETEFFKACQNIVLKNATLVAFCSTRRKDTACEMDEGLNAALSANTDAVSIFGKCWDMQVSEILNVSNEENLQMIYESISYLKESGKYIIFDAEHFFDGYKSNKDYAMDTLRIAQKAGADVLCLCDTNGGCFTYEIEKIVACVSKKFPDISIGIHCHNDIGCAVSNSIAAVLAGAVHVQGTYLGFGERCGNANLSTIIPSLQLKLGYECINSDKISSITNAANSIAEILNTSVKK
ncbi:MAG: citramalate synthase, partial [Oscillospiraceae bacterium]